MSRILVLFSSIDGHTARIADCMAQTLRAAGHEVTIRPASLAHAADDAGRFDGVILGAAIRYGKYAKDLAPLVRTCLKPLSIPTAFFSVCLSASGPGARPQAAQSYIDTLLSATSWRPRQVRSFGGALRYPRYRTFTRLMIRFIMTVTGGDTDTSREYDYTDWTAVMRFAREFAVEGRRLQ
jgi:menaquinone-dependent protoporphyrinogen oxidase